MSRSAVVFGSGALVNALLRAWAPLGSVCLACPEPPSEPPPGLWRRIDEDTGEGVRQALTGATHVLAVVAPDRPAHGLWLVLRALADLRGIVVTPLGLAPPVALDPLRWSHLEVGWTFGPGDPWWDRWNRRARRRLPLLAPRTAPLPVVHGHEAVEAIRLAEARVGPQPRLLGRPQTVREAVHDAWPLARTLPVPAAAFALVDRPAMAEWTRLAALPLRALPSVA